MNREQAATAVLLSLVSLVACGSNAASDAHPASPPAATTTASMASATPPAPLAHAVQAHSSSIAASPDGSRLFVVHPDADSVTVLDTATRHIVEDVLLAASAPTLSVANRYEPAVEPRALALNSTATMLYVTGQRSGHVYAIDPTSGTVKANVAVCSEPMGILVSKNDASVFVACAQDDAIAELRASDLGLLGTVTCPRKPWALAWAADGRTLLATHFLGPGVSTLSTAPFTINATWSLADGPPQGDPEDPTEPHGQVRGIYDAVVRPGTSEVWVAHLMLGTDTTQPSLNFQETVFPSLSILDSTGTQSARLSVQANPGDGEAFGDVVSGPRALTFSTDGKFAFVVDTDSEDVLVVDAQRRVEAQLVRPLPGHLPEGIVLSAGKLYVQERNTEDIASFDVVESDAGVTLTANGAAFPSLAQDPMPANLRLGQKLFYSADSDDVPLTQNHWVACASCHLEGRSDAVTWLFAQGPRDTPTNAGGLLDTGFLFRTADRNQVQDYWKTIDVEQGGHFQITEPTQKPLLDALAAYVNYAIPAPVAPSTDATHALQGKALADLRARGAAVFTRLGCDTCHRGPAKTDSGYLNPMLNLSAAAVSSPTLGGILLHDVGTCVTTGAWPDVSHQDIQGDARDACAFDTPALRGLSDTAPYLHDGSAATLADVLPPMLKATVAAGQAAPTLSTDDQQSLVEYLRSL
jgi:YVTN family beta-propeller protein